MRNAPIHRSKFHRDLVSQAQHRAATGSRQWSFVYCFFTNNMPFSAPNRSEPCPARG